MKKIIHVDNSHFFRKQMEIFLRKEGFEVENFDTGEDAAFVISGGGAALVVCGLTLGDMDGKTFIKKIKEYYAGPVIILSSSIEKENEAALSRLGVTAALKKSGGWEEALRPFLQSLA
ncbi:MAG: response regulator [Treponema sp.]|jgi:two-component system KDP operon response regulator KdpE|nr:response regulator [Treponema sp.]